MTMTYAEALNVAIKAMGSDHKDAVERLEALKAQLAKRGSKGGMTKTQKANEILKEAILEVLGEAEEFLLLADFRNDARLADLSTQKMGALLGQLVKAGKVQKVMYKKHTMYGAEGVDFVAPDAPVDDADDAEDTAE